MLSKMGFPIIYILHHSLKVANITLKVEWVNRHLKWNPLLPCNFFCEIVKAVLMESPSSCMAAVAVIAPERQRAQTARS